MTATRRAVLANRDSTARLSGAMSAAEKASTPATSHKKPGGKGQFPPASYSSAFQKLQQTLIQVSSVRGAAVLPRNPVTSRPPRRVCRPVLTRPDPARRAAHPRPVA